MQVTSKGLFRSVMTGAIALGFMGTAAISPVSAQSILCQTYEPGTSEYRALQTVDVIYGNSDGIASTQEIASVSDDPDLQSIVAQLEDGGYTGIQYDGNCETPTDPTPEPTADPGDGTTDPTPAPTAVPGDGDDNGDGDGDGTTDPGNGDGDGTTNPGSGDGVSELPDTGDGVTATSNNTGWLVLAFGSVIATLGAFGFRTKKA